MSLRKAILTLLLAPLLHAQQTQPIPTLRTSTHLVVLDVVVTDRNHNPIRNLKPTDFSVQENKSPQTISHFEEHTPLSAGEALKFPPTPTLPPGVFTNVTPAPTNSAVNILLLDTLNTPVADQQYLHQQLRDYLKTPHPGTSVAIFGLSSRLVLLQGFTSDPETLRRAIEAHSGKASPLLPDRIGGGTQGETTSDTISALGIGGGTSGLSDALTFFDQQISINSLEIRSRLTLDSINTLARYLSSIPGRKNLIWFAGSFPVDLTSGISSGNFSNPFLDLPSGEAEYRDTVNLLARSQVAVYPIDARGLQVGDAFQAANGTSLHQPSPRVADPSLDAIAQDHLAAGRIAGDTGGHAFYNINNLSQALNTAITEGSSYYTLTYSPTNSAWNDDYRKIEVKLAEHGYQLAYRRGYYAINPDSRLTALTSASTSAPGTPTTAPQLTTLRRAMVHGVPGPTEILFKARVLPAPGEPLTQPSPTNVLSPTGLNQAHGLFNRYLVDFDTEGHDFVLTPNPDGTFHLKAEFAALLYQRADGRLIDTVSRTLVAEITPTQRAQILHTGLPCRLELTIPASSADYTLRLGVHDFASDRVGSLELPLAAVPNTTANANQ